MNWHINQQVICIDNKGSSLLKLDEIYFIKGIRNGCCGIEIYVGFNNENPNYRLLLCTRCNSIYKQDGKQWHFENRFSPLADISELEELLKEQPKEIQQ